MSQDIPWGNIPDDQFSLKAIYGRFGGFGRRKAKKQDMRLDGTKKVWTTESRVCRGKQCNNMLFPVMFEHRQVYPQYCGDCQKPRHDFHVWEIGVIDD